MLGNYVQNRRVGAWGSLGRAGLLISGKPAKCGGLSRTAPDRRSARPGCCSTGRSSLSSLGPCTPDSFSDRNNEELPTVEILRDQTKRSFEVSRPAGTDRRSPKSKAAVWATMRGRQWNADEYGSRKGRPTVRNPSDTFMSRSDAGKVGNIFSARNSPELLTYPVAGLPHECEAELATSPFSVRVMMPNGKPGFARLTIVINRATGFILAASVQQRGRNPDIDHLVQQATSPLVTVHGGRMSNLRISMRMNFPSLRFLDDAKRCRAAAPRASVRIVSIPTDDSMDRSLGHQAACRRSGIIVTKTTNFSPVDSSVGERAFSTIYEHFREESSRPGWFPC
ncbi:hypothetical protein ACVWZ7_003863 [Arthrobacter sp. TE12232]